MLTTVFAAITIHKFINSVGDYVGFASIIAVAILILLYFAHARETATLREQLEETQGRILGLEARIAQLMQAQAAAQRGRAPVQPAPVPSPVRPIGAAVASVRRIPTAVAGAVGAATPAAGAATAAFTPAVATAAAANGFPPAAPVGMAAPALASATKLIPDPPLPKQPVSTPDDTVFVPAAAAAAATAAAATAAAVANGQAEAPPRPAPAVAAPVVAGPVVAAPVVAGPEVAAAAASAAATAAAAGASVADRPRANDAPPRVQIGADADARAASPRRTFPSSRGVPPVSPLLPTEQPPGRLSGRVVPLVVAGIAMVVIIAGLIVITNTGGSTTAVPNNGAGATLKTGQSLSQHHRKAPVFKPSTVTISVLNGTAVSGLAGDVGKKLAGAGYKQGNITNAASQTEPTTVVYYLPGAAAKANRTAAQHVASELKLSASRVHPATQTAITSCSTSVTGTVGNSCDANVIVSVGADRADLASGNGG